MKLLLCTDLDRTLLPNGAAPESADARPLFGRLVARPEVTLVYVSGRDLGLIDAAIAEYGLPRPDVAIGDVGATIAAGTTLGWEPWRDWERRLSEVWGGRRATDLRGLLAGIPDLIFQAPERQGPFKLSFVVPMNADVSTLVSAVTARLAGAGVRSNVIHSLDDEAQVGLVDVLPATATKRMAVEYVRRQLGFAREEVLFAGDSGNDLDALVSAIPAVVVGNASPALKEAATRGAIAAGHERWLHLARGGVLGLNGNYAAGILEGVLHFQPGWAKVLKEQD